MIQAHPKEPRSIRLMAPRARNQLIKTQHLSHNRRVLRRILDDSNKHRCGLPLESRL